MIHFGHAYTRLKGTWSRNERTKDALIHMGPSVLAASLTTICAAAVMLFCIIIFYVRFAQVLLLSILMATVGSFIVFLTLTDIFGPSDPSSLSDCFHARLFGKIKNKANRERIESLSTVSLSPPASEAGGETETVDWLSKRSRLAMFLLHQRDVP